MTAGSERLGSFQQVEDHVLEALRDLIVRGEILPGTPLRLEVLAQRLAVSTLPVRSALTRLAAEGLVHRLPRRGAIVAPLEYEDFEEIQTVRTAVERLAARIGAERLGDRELVTMKELMVELRRTARDEELDAYIVQHWRLYDVCYEAAGRPRLLRVIAEYRRRAERYVRVVVGSRYAFREPVEYQDRFLRACNARSGDDAQRVLEEAFSWTLDTIGKLVQPPPRGELSTKGAPEHEEVCDERAW